MARPNEPDMPPKRTINGTIRYLLYINSEFVKVSMISKPYQVSDFILQDIRTVDKPSDWLIPNLGTVIFFDKPNTRSSLPYLGVKDVGFFNICSWKWLV